MYLSGGLPDGLVRFREDGFFVRQRAHNRRLEAKRRSGEMDGGGDGQGKAQQNQKPDVIGEGLGYRVSEKRLSRKQNERQDGTDNEEAALFSRRHAWISPELNRAESSAISFSPNCPPDTKDATNFLALPSNILFKKVCVAHWLYSASVITAP